MLKTIFYAHNLKRDFAQKRGKDRFSGVLGSNQGKFVVSDLDLYKVNERIVHA